MPINRQEAQDLRDRRQRLYEEGATIVRTAHEADRAMNPEERSNWDRIQTDVNDLTTRIEEVELTLTQEERAKEEVRKVNKVRDRVLEDATSRAEEEGLTGRAVSEARENADRELILSLVGAEQRAAVLEMENEQGWTAASRSSIGSPGRATTNTRSPAGAVRAIATSRRSTARSSPAPRTPARSSEL